MVDINVNKLGEALNGKADIDLNNTGVFSTNGGGGVNLVSSTPTGAESKEVVSADFVSTYVATNEQVLNNPFSFGDSKYSPIELDNISWLRSQGQWNAKTVYPNYYEWLLQKRNEQIKTLYALKRDDTVSAWVLSDNPQVGDGHYGYTPNGNAGPITAVSGTTITVHNIQVNSTATLTLDVSTTTQLYTLPENGIGVITKEELDSWNYPLSSPDYCWVINTVDETFRLPLLNNEENLLDWASLLYGILPETITSSVSKFTAPKNGIVEVTARTNGINAWFVNVNATKVFTGGSPDAIQTFNGISIRVNKGDVVSSVCNNTTVTEVTSLFIPFKGNDSLYFYVGETVQNANLIDAGRLAEQLSNKIDKNGVSVFVVDTWSSGSSWYRVWSDGWIEQGGINTDQSSTNVIVNLNKAFVNNVYTTIVNSFTEISVNVNSSTQDKTTSSFKIYKGNATTFTMWYACGY